MYTVPQSPTYVDCSLTTDDIWSQGRKFAWVKRLQVLRDDLYVSNSNEDNFRIHFVDRERVFVQCIC